MKTNPRVKGLVYCGAVSFGTGLYLLNASWLASPPQEQTTIIAQRGLHQAYGRDGVDDETCTARRIAMPAHQFIDNTLPSITAAFGLGADVVEIDVRLTKDGSFMLFHDASLECRNSGTGSVSEHTVARVWSAHSSAHCLLGYLELGWMNHVPAVCDDAIIIVPIAQRGLVWGWPYRFLTRMREHRTEVMLIGRIDGLSGANFSRLDATEEVSLLPAAFDGSIWTDRIDVIGRALKDRAKPN